MQNFLPSECLYSNGGDKPPNWKVTPDKTTLQCQTENKVREEDRFLSDMWYCYLSGKI